MTATRPGVSAGGLRLAMLAAAAVAVLAGAPGAWAPATYGARTTADEPHYLLTTISLAEDGDLDLSDELAAGRAATFHRATLPVQERRLADGRMPAPHDPLLPALLVPGWLIGGWVGAKLTIALLAGALAALLVWTAVRRLAVPPVLAATGVALFAASMPLAPYATQVYPELPAALAVTAAVAAGTGRLDRRALIAVAVAVVALPWLAVKYVPVAATLAALVGWRLVRDGRSGALGALAGVLAVAGAGYAAAHLAWYGGLTVYAAGQHFVGDGQLSVMGTTPHYVGRSTRLMGLLVGRRFGLAAWQPAWLLLVPAVGALVRRRPAGWDLVVGPLAAGWLSATFLALTMQGWWMPGRQVVVVLPLAVLAVLWWAAGTRSRWLVLGVAGVLGVVAYGWLLAEGLTGGLTWVVDFFTTSSPWYRAWRHALPDLLHPAAGDWALQAVWSAVGLGLLWWGWRTAAEGAGAVHQRRLSRSR